MEFSDFKIRLYKKNIENLKIKIKRSCEIANRKVDEILIVAASKYADAENIGEVMKLGIRNFGENRAEELAEKYRVIGNSAVWHFIGHLQSNKVKTVVPIVDYIHSIDKITTLEKINEEAKKINKTQKVLVELNISGEDTKFGIEEGNLKDFLITAFKFDHISVKGLMTMAPLTDEREYIRKIFRKLRELRDASNKISGISGLTELSMGMSNDFEIAIQEGSTMIRIGSSLFK
ncbi:MAG: YggS family pyridoxal phosphate-dependent enzyme [Actinobacteria bacterium]|nr:YggS family pyridoxal phosphate-dependent enzyme [Actinomycetota bacterium]